MPMPENSDNAPKGSPLGSRPQWFRRVRQGFVLAVILGVTPAFAADPDNGERLARRWCSPRTLRRILRRSSSSTVSATVYLIRRCWRQLAGEALMDRTVAHFNIKPA
jgi:hypothetical protein